MSLIHYCKNLVLVVLIALVVGCDPVKRHQSDLEAGGEAAGSAAYQLAMYARSSVDKSPDFVAYIDYLMESAYRDYEPAQRRLFDDLREGVRPRGQTTGPFNIEPNFTEAVAWLILAARHPESYRSRRALEIVWQREDGGNPETRDPDRVRWITDEEREQILLTAEGFFQEIQEWLGHEIPPFKTPETLLGLPPPPEPLPMGPGPVIPPADTEEEAAEEEPGPEAQPEPEASDDDNDNDNEEM